jgi:hypothetical protein
MTTDARVHLNLTPRARILGICWIIYGFIRLCIALWLTTFSTIATLMFGALLARVPDPFTLMSAFHFIYLGLVVWSAVAGVVGIVAGFALLAGRRSARALVIAAAFLSLCEFPLGLALGVYSLIVLLPANPELDRLPQSSLAPGSFAR